MSFLDEENEQVVDLVEQEVAQELFNDWYNALLDEGQLYADYRFLLLADNNYLNGRYNQYYDLKPGDEYYMPWDEEA
jgi:hypothetical protein